MRWKMDKQLAARLHSVIVAATASVDDKTASITPELFPQLKQDGSLVAAGSRINWNDILKRGFKATFFYKNDKIYVKYIFISF